jgi:tRNA nucleotidyltransferase (CCA-adding enzyme)
VASDAGEIDVSERGAAGTTAVGSAVIEALGALPGGRELLEVGRRREDLALVGGAVRDLLLDARPRELDVTVAGEPAALAEQLAAMLPREDARPPETTVHDRFGTAAVEWSGGRVDIAERRAESYPYPGSLPEVRPGSGGEDLARRDFTVNAMAVPLGGPRLGELEAVEHASEDLAARRLRVLHERSFLDDPIRLLRLARYSARLGFEIEAETARLAHSALRGGALETVSGARVGAELWLAAEEAAPARAFVKLGELGVLGALSLPAPFDERLLLDAGALLPADGVPAILVMAVLFHPAAEPPQDARGRAAAQMIDFEFLAHTRERVLAGAFDSFALAAAIERSARPSQLREALAGRPAEAIAIAGALGGRRSPEVPRRARAWLEELRAVRLEIGGADLLAAGLPEGPEIGRRLQRVLDLKLDGRLANGREAELQAALEVPA